MLARMVSLPKDVGSSMVNWYLLRKAKIVDVTHAKAVLMLQVILGYVLLGALVTRFAVLFTAGGPAGKFSD